jgi:hypothetical protein
MRAVTYHAIVVVLILTAQCSLGVLSGLVHEAAAQGVQDVVTGHADFINAVGNHVRYSFSAIRHPDGRVSGEVEEHVETSAGDFIRRGHGSVICMAVNGNIARMAGIIDQIAGEGVPPIGTHFILTVIDNGEEANAPPDLATTAAAVSSEEVAQNHCTTGISRPLFPIAGGDIQVRAAEL